MRTSHHPRLITIALLVIMIFSTALVAVPVQAQEAAKIQFWHAMSGSRGKVLDELVKKFNDANKDVQITATFKGSYAETLTAALAATKAGEAPHIVQIYEVGTRTMLDTGVIVPISEISKGKIDASKYVEPVVNYYSVDGKLHCMPFNSSTAMLYYNKDIFAKVGLDPEKPPTSVDEIYTIGKKIMDAKAAKGAISFGWPAWIFEQMFAMHSQFIANQDNGRSGLATEVYFNSPFGVKVLTEWQKWAKDGVLVYGGREYNANDPFVAGEFAMLAQSTSSLSGIEKAAKFKVGTTFLPRFDGFEKGNNVIGGGCLWTMAGKTPVQYDAVWRFYQFLAETENDIAWHKGTGYFPLAKSSVEALEKEGWFQKNPNFRTAFDQILKGNNTKAAQGVLLGDFATIRDIAGAAIEESVVNKKDPKTVLDEATKQTNQLLADYASLNAPKK